MFCQSSSYRTGFCMWGGGGEAECVGVCVCVGEWLRGCVGVGVDVSVSERD